MAWGGGRVPNPPDGEGAKRARNLPPAGDLHEVSSQVEQAALSFVEVRGLSGAP